MKRLTAPAVLLLAALPLLGGCASASFLGLAKQSSVDETEARTRADLARLDDEIRRLEEDRTDRDARLEALAADIGRLTGQMDDVAKSRDELMALADEVEKRLEDLPEETLRELVDALEAYLDG